MPVTVVSSRDQQPITVNTLIRQPTVVPERIIALLQNQFVTDRVLRNVGSAPGGAVQWRVASPIFADQASSPVAEGAEIPVVTVSRGDIKSSPTQKHGLSVIITREMRDRDAVGEVERQIQVISNTLVRDIDAAFINTIQNGPTPVTQARAATAAWSSASTATIRKDINAAAQLVRQAALAQQANNWFGYEPDTIILNPTDATNLANSTEFTALLFGSVQPSNLDPNTLDGRNVLGLTLMVSRAWPAGSPLVCQREVLGGYADEVPLEATGLYPQQERQVWRSDVVRTTVGFVDQPQAGAWITGT